MSKIELLKTIKVHDQKGNLIYEKTTPCKSWVLQFLQMLEAFMAAASGDPLIVSPKNTANVAKGLPDDAAVTSIYIHNYNALVNIDDYGIVVGTGTGAESDTDVALGTQIAHGVAATELAHGATSFVTSQKIGANIDFKISRTFTNSSGATIVVEEAGLYAKAMDRAASIQYFMTARDLTGGVTVLNTQILTVEYTLRTTV